MDNIQTVSKDRLGPATAYLSPDRMIEVNRAVAFALGLDTLISW
jgi:mRNA-degrading endonuclease toxin of MazEF toxin-antitoxin module